jgi:hypothetical protein
VVRHARPGRALAERHWALLLSHPWLLQIAASRPLLGPSLTAFYDAELAAVDGLGLTDIDMDLVVSLLDDYVRGAARGAVEAAEAHARTGVSDQQWWQTYGPLLAEVLDSARYPTAIRVGSARRSRVRRRPRPAPLLPVRPAAHRRRHRGLRHRSIPLTAVS